MNAWHSFFFWKNHEDYSIMFGKTIWFYSIDLDCGTILVLLTLCQFCFGEYKGSKTSDLSLVLRFSILSVSFNLFWLCTWEYKRTVYKNKKDEYIEGLYDKKKSRQSLLLELWNECWNNVILSYVFNLVLSLNLRRTDRKHAIIIRFSSLEYKCVAVLTKCSAIKQPAPLLVRLLFLAVL